MSREQSIEAFTNTAAKFHADSKQLFVGFIDLCGSTDYKAEIHSNDLPDFVWITRQLIFLNRTAQIIKQYKGEVVKTIGDAVFYMFASNTKPEIILKANIEILQSFEGIEMYSGSSKIHAKSSIDIGLTYNGSIKDDYDPIGLVVDRCARLNSESGPDEIIVSEDFFTALNTSASKKKIKEKYGFSKLNAELRGLGKTTYYRISVSSTSDN